MIVGELVGQGLAPDHLTSFLVADQRTHQITRTNVIEEEITQTVAANKHIEMSVDLHAYPHLEVIRPIKLKPASHR